MFWGCFNGTMKGPYMFWEKEWGSITSQIYCDRIIPLIQGWLRMPNNGHLLYMQDGAPSHTAAATKEELCERGIPIIIWPPYSPDLNPIETVRRRAQLKTDHFLNEEHQNRDFFKQLYSINKL